MTLQNVCDSFAVNEVTFLPNDIHHLKSSSITLNTINHKQCSRHELSLCEYEQDIKYINTQNIEPKISSICNNANNEINTIISLIDKKHFTSIQDLSHFTSVDQFNEVWNMIRDKINDINVVIDCFCNDLVDCEKSRLEMIKEIMCTYFERLLSHGKWDKSKIIEYLNHQSVTFNHQAINHFQNYFHLIANLKVWIATEAHTYHKYWEKQLLAWRDYLVKKNVEVIENIIKSNEYSNPEIINHLRTETYGQLHEIDSSIKAMYKDVIVNLPYNRHELTIVTGQIDKKLEEKNILKESFLRNSKIHYDSLVDKLEKRLLDMKEFLFREASCSNSQFLKTFSRFVGDGPSSYEMSVEKIQFDDNMTMTGNIKLMGDAHCSLQRFLFSICDLWVGNDDKVQIQKHELLNTLEEKRTIQEQVIRKLEYSIDNNVSKIMNLKSHKQVDKLQDTITSDLKRLENRFRLFNKDAMVLINQYPDTCIGQIAGYETEMLKLIGMRKCDSHETNLLCDKTSFIRSTTPDLNNDYNESKELCELIKEEARQFIIKHVVSNGENLLNEAKSLEMSLRNEVSKEHDLRICLHKPRQEIIMAELQTRKVNIDNFNETFQQYCDISPSYEEGINIRIDKFNQTAYELILHIQNMVENAEEEYLDTSKSSILKNKYNSNEELFSKEENKLQDITKSILIELDKHAKMMKTKEDNLLQFATRENFDISEKSKLYQEFCAIKETIKSITLQTKKMVKTEETVKKKQIVAILYQHKVFYKHCLLGLFFLEMKSNLLSNCRIKIKSAISYGNKDLRDAKNKINNLKSQMKSISKESRCVATLTKAVCSEYKELFLHFKKMINCLNYRCSPITVNENHSLLELNRKYESFGIPDGDVSETIEFSKEIINMTSLKRDKDLAFQCHKIDAEPKDWIAKKGEVEKKYITGRLGCVFGVGATLMDIPTHPWTGVCTNLSSSCKSFWLSNNPQGLMALEEIKEKRRAKSSMENKNINDESASTDHELKVRNISERIRKSINVDIPKNPFSENRGSHILPDKLRRLKEITEGIMKSDEEQSQEKLTRQVTLPAIDTKSIKYAGLKRNSGNQIDMQKALTLSKTVELMYKSRRRRSSYFHQRAAQKIPIYDFLLMDDDELEKVVFDPVSFFRLHKRSFCVDDLCQTIVSVLEKVKFYLFNLQEDFIITCIVFYRQKHLCIKYPQNIAPNCDSAIKKFRQTLGSYLKETKIHCNKTIEVIRSSLGCVYELFEENTSILFAKIYSDSHKVLLQNYEIYHKTFDELIQKNEDKKHEIWKSLRPSISHPKNQDVLEKLCKNESARSEYFVENLKQMYAGLSTDLVKQYEGFISNMKSCTAEMVNVAEEAIQLEDIRKITSNESNTFEVKARLRKCLVPVKEEQTVPPKKLNTYSPLPDISDITSDTNINVEGSAELVQCDKVNTTREKLKFGVIKLHDKYFSEFTAQYRCKLETSKQIYETAVNNEKYWNKRWKKSVKELKCLVKFEE